MNLTVEEAIYYSSNLKMNKSAENDKIEQLIEQLELTNCRSTLVKSCSGGQKKRIAIAQELVGSIKPRLLFLGKFYQTTQILDEFTKLIAVSLFRYRWANLRSGLECKFCGSKSITETV